jgi:hypothetical protein
VLFPESLTIRKGESWSFVAALGEVGYASITHMPEPASWSIQEGAAGGSITADGVYTAPSVEGVYHVVGISQNDPTKTATNPVTVGGGLVLSGDSNAAHLFHTATLLPSGRVIVAGGLSASLDYAQQQIIDSADQYDPSTAVFQSVAKVTRSNHTATLLPNGDLLFLGGYSAIVPSGPNDHPVTPVPTATAEILSAATGTIQPAGDIGIARAGHTATLLANGKILITGGYVASPSALNPIPTSTSALYDPASGTSSPTGDMSVARSGHLAILLRNGKVLVFGAGSAELFDPATNSFTPTGSPAFRGGGSSDWGIGPTATLLPNGKVLVTGGWVRDPLYYPWVAIDTAEIYDPAAGQFAPTGKLTIARSSHTATLLPNGTVLIAGGYTKPPINDDDAPIIATTEIFDPQTNSFTPGHAMKIPRESHTATLLLDGTILFVGGSWDSPNTSTEIFH